MQIDVTALVTSIVPPQYQAYITLGLFLVYVIGNAVMPFLPNESNGWEHALVLFFKNLWKCLRVDKSTKDVTLGITANSDNITDSALAKYMLEKSTSSTYQAAPAAIQEPQKEVSPNEKTAPAVPGLTGAPLP